MKKRFLSLIVGAMLLSFGGLALADHHGGGKADRGAMTEEQKAEKRSKKAAYHRAMAECLQQEEGSNYKECRSSLKEEHGMKSKKKKGKHRKN